MSESRQCWNRTLPLLGMVGAVLTVAGCANPFGPEDLVATWQLETLNDADPGSLVVALRMEPEVGAIGQCAWHVEDGSNVTDLECTYLYGEVQGSLDLTVGQSPSQQFLSGGIRDGTIVFTHAPVPGAPQLGDANTLVFVK